MGTIKLSPGFAWRASFSICSKRCANFSTCVQNGMLVQPGLRKKITWPARFQASTSWGFFPIRTSADRIIQSGSAARSPIHFTSGVSALKRSRRCTISCSPFTNSLSPRANFGARFISTKNLTPQKAGLQKQPHRALLRVQPRTSVPPTQSSHDWL